MFVLLHYTNIQLSSDMALVNATSVIYITGDRKRWANKAYV